MIKFDYQSMGTSWQITIWDQIEPNKAELLKQKIWQILNDFDQTYSRFIPTSLVSKLAKTQGVQTVPSDFIAMLKMYFDLYLPSNKKLNPLIGFTISDLGYDANYSLTPKETIRQTPDLFETVKIISDNQIETTKPVLFDFGALGKGYAVDKVSDFLKAESINHFLVNGSGDIYYFGKEEIKVGLEDPTDQTKVIGAIAMSQGAMCASGTNRRRWREHHHVIDPHTSLSTKGLVASWVIAQNTTLADGLASFT